MADPYTKRYAAWETQHLAGLPGTDGQFDNAMFHYAISPQAQEPNALETQGYAAAARLEAWRTATGFTG